MAGRPRKNVAVGGENIGGEGGMDTGGTNVTAAGTIKRGRGGARRRKRGAGTGTSALTGTRGRPRSIPLSSFSARDWQVYNMGQLHASTHS